MTILIGSSKQTPFFFREIKTSMDKNREVLVGLTKEGSSKQIKGAYLNDIGINLTT
jgi:hypothetical protein